MARLVTAGAETKDVTTEGLDQSGIVGAALIDATNVRSGNSAFKATSNKGAIFAIAGVLGTTVFVRAYVYRDPTASGQQALCVVIDGSTHLFQGLIRINASEQLELVYGNSTGIIYSGGTIVGTGPTVPKGEWHRVELAVRIGVGAVDYIEGLLDGVSFASGSSLAISELAPAFAGVLGFDAGALLWFDDIAVNDSSGADQNTWAGDGKVVLLLPTSDNAVGTGWTLGTGTAPGGNAFAAVDNAPPVGVADLAVGSDPKQIRNATSNANSNYDANLSSYSSAGIGPYDRINLVVPIVATAAPVTTSAKQGTIGIVSNPTIANVALGAGGVAGAFWSGGAAGAYPTGWKISRGTTTYNPAVTISTSPVARITQVTASTRIAMVCALGLYVDYTPFSPPARTIRGAQDEAHRPSVPIYAPPMG